MPEDLNKKNKDLWTKLMFGVLCFFGISALILGVLQISKTINIKGNYSSQPGKLNLNDLSNKLETGQRTVEELQKADTDGDGLNDFEELYVYKTSPYLADSDSDGYTDKEEIDGGYDPNCPKGQDCRGSSGIMNNESGIMNNDFNNLGDGIQPTENNLPTDLSEQLKNLSPAEVRQLLLKSGKITEEQLNQIGDQTLMKLFKETLTQNATSSKQ